MQKSHDHLRPRLKPTVQTILFGDSVLFRASGAVFEVEDERGLMRAMLEVMNGERSVPAVHAALAERYPALRWGDLLEIIDALDARRLLEDAAIGPEGLSDYELRRWDRNINFLGSFCGIGEDKYELQRRIKRARVTLLGLGGLGSHLLFDLAALGVMDVLAVDFDRVEIANLNRQILYGDNDIGRPKAEVAAERIRAFSPRMRFTALERRIGSAGDALDVIAGRDIVICVADRPKMEIIEWVNEACVRAGVPLVGGGLDTQRARWYSMIPGETGCLMCWRAGLRASDPYSDEVLTEQRRTALRGDNAAFVPFVSLVTGFMTAELVKITTGLTPPSAGGKVWELDFTDMQTRVTESWRRTPDCPLCGGAAQAAGGARMRP